MTTEQKYDTPLEIDGPVDLDALKNRVQKEGPLVLGGRESTVQVKIDLLLDESNNGDQVIFSIVLLSGVTSLSTLVDGSVLQGFPSISEFAETFFREPHRLFAPLGELSYIKDKIGQHLGVDVEELFAKGIPADGLKQKLSANALADPWMANNLAATLDALYIHREMLEGVGLIDGEQTIREEFPIPNDLVLLMEQHYSLGFLTARLVSENFVRYAIEPFAFKGLAFDEAQQHRTTASGKSSSKKRRQRVEAVLGAMEALCAKNPSLGRVGIKALAELAIEDCVDADPQLWRQGKGQRDQYLDEMKSDLKYQSRFRVLMSKTA